MAGAARCHLVPDIDAVKVLPLVGGLLPGPDPMDLQFAHPRICKHGWAHPREEERFVGAHFNFAHPAKDPWVRRWGSGPRKSSPARGRTWWTSTASVSSTRWRYLCLKYILWAGDQHRSVAPQWLTGCMCRPLWEKRCVTGWAVGEFTTPASALIPCHCKVCRKVVRLY